MVRRLMVFMPPGSAKSTYASKLFPAWWMARFPGAQVIGAAHTQTLADTFSGDVQRFVRDNSATLGYGLETEAKDIWRATNGGRYRAAGVGAKIPGFRANLALGDDLVPGAEGADSEQQRDNIWRWYLGDLDSRLTPGAPVVIVMCMVGQTLVLMGDGTRKRLADIRPGDKIATYDNGILAITVVEAWKSQGRDDVFEIHTQSGATTKANARHPFLVERDGKRTWVRLRDLLVGDGLVRASTIGLPMPSVGHGKARHAAQTDAKDPLNARAFVRATTTRTDGLVGAVSRRIVRLTGGLLAYATDMVLTFLTTKQCLNLKMAYAPSAAPPLAPKCPNTGAECFASITITPPERCAGFFATTATSWLGKAKTKPSCSEQWNTSEFTLDRVTAIVAAGSEEVFDVQVARTGNFIADGFISHNTRWHEDDIAGRLLLHQPDTWRVVTLPALAEADDPLGRAVGEPLWSDDAYGYGAHVLAKRDELMKAGAARMWHALYQQKPRPPEGQLFKVAMLRPTPAETKGLRCVRAWDLAATADTGRSDPDWTCGVKLGRAGDHGSWTVLDVHRFRGPPEEVERTILGMAHVDGVSCQIGLPQDPGQAGKAQIAVMTRMLSGFRVVSSPETGDKATRAAPAAAQVNVGNVSLLAKADGSIPNWHRPFIEELRDFPTGRKDDQVDAFSRAFSMLATSYATTVQPLRLW